MEEANIRATFEGMRNRQWPRYLLGIAAVIELAGGLNDWPTLAGDLGNVTGHALLGWIAVIKIALVPILALAALAFVIVSQLQPALLAFAAIILLEWLTTVRGGGGRGIDLQGELWVNAQVLYQNVLVPLLALAVAFLALARERYTLAAVLAALPTVINAASLIAFAIGLGIYSF